MNEKTGSKPAMPLEKIYEAWTAIADGRVEFTNGSTIADGTAYVDSSDGQKRYTVKWREGGKIFTSTDNATYWRGYPGYPVVAVLMGLGVLSYNIGIARKYRGINWTKLNTKHKRDYSGALQEVEDERGIDSASARKEAELIEEELLKLHITIKRK